MKLKEIFEENFSLTASYPENTKPVFKTKAGSKDEVDKHVSSMHDWSKKNKKHINVTVVNHSTGEVFTHKIRHG